MRIIFTLLLFCLFACQEKSVETTKTVDAQKTDTSQKKVAKEPIKILKAEDQPDYDKERWTSYDYRDQNWHPEKGQYYFAEQWTWQYENQFMPAGEFGSKGKMSIFVDPVTGTMLFTRAEANLSDDMVEAVLTKPDGSFVLCYKDEFGKKYRYETQTNAITKWETTKQSALDSFQEQLHPTGKEKVFGENKYKNPTITGRAYEMNFQKTNDHSLLYLAPVPFDLHALYLINKVSKDIKAPLNISYQNVLPANYLVLSEKYEQNGKKYEFFLEGMSNTEMHFSVNDYALKK